MSHTIHCAVLPIESRGSPFFGIEGRAFPCFEIEGRAFPSFEIEGCAFPPFEKGGQGGFALRKQQQQIFPNPPFAKEGARP